MCLQAIEAVFRHHGERLRARQDLFGLSYDEGYSLYHTNTLILNF